METLTEIENAEHKRREHAHSYEKALAERDRLNKSDEAMHKMDFSALPLLARMREDAATLPKGLLTKGTRTFPGGFVAREMLGQILAAMWADLEAKRIARDQILAVNAKKREANEKTLADLQLEVEP